MNISLEQDFIFLDIDKKQAEILNAVWNDKRKMWRVPSTIGSLNEIYGLTSNEEIRQQYLAKVSARNHFLAKKRLEDAPGPKELRPYQRVDVSYLDRIPSAAIFNEQRTGKTPTTLKLIESKQFKKGIIVCPASLTLNWKEEVEKWTSLVPHVLEGTKTKRKKILQAFKSGLLITSYETLRNDIDLFTSNYDCLVVDEAHRLRNHKSAQSKALFRLGKKASNRYALTGTPAVNHGADVWGILHFLYPSKFPGYWQFVDRYFEVKDGWFGKEVGRYKRKKELQEILDVISVQRKRSDVMKWLPPKQYITHTLQADTKQMKAYKDMLDTFVVEQDGEIKADAPSVLAQLTRLRQITLSPELLDIQAKSAKEQFILEWLDNNTEPVIIFSSFTSYLKLLWKKLGGRESTVMIHGEMTSEQKQESVKQFQSGKKRIMLANIQAAGVGFTLDKAETAIFLDRAYTVSDNQQAEDRIIPVSEERNHSCTIIDLVVKDTIDEKIHELLKQKKSVIDVVNNYGIKYFK